MPLQGLMNFQFVTLGELIASRLRTGLAKDLATRACGIPLLLK
jgi:hypothetical protein